MESEWSNMSSWFQDFSDKKAVVNGFNNAARAAYINGNVPNLVKCSLSRGCKAFKHANSSFFQSGFRIVAMTDKALSENELNIIGLSILGDSRIVRLLMALGWDTLEVIDNNSDEGLHWKLANFS